MWKRTAKSSFSNGCEHGKKLTAANVQLVCLSVAVTVLHEKKHKFCYTYCYTVYWVSSKYLGSSKLIYCKIIPSFIPARALLMLFYLFSVKRILKSATLPKLYQVNVSLECLPGSMFNWNIIIVENWSSSLRKYQNQLLKLRVLAIACFCSSGAIIQRIFVVLQLLPLTLCFGTENVPLHYVILHLIFFGDRDQPWCGFNYSILVQIAYYALRSCDVLRADCGQVGTFMI